MEMLILILISSLFPQLPIFFHVRILDTFFFFVSQFISMFFFKILVNSLNFSSCFWFPSETQNGMEINL